MTRKHTQSEVKQDKREPTSHTEQPWPDCCARWAASWDATTSPMRKDFVLDAFSLVAAPRFFARDRGINSLYNSEISQPHKRWWRRGVLRDADLPYIAMGIHLGVEVIIEHTMRQGQDGFKQRNILEGKLEELLENGEQITTLVESSGSWCQVMSGNFKSFGRNILAFDHDR